MIESAARSAETWSHSGHADGGVVARFRVLLRAWLNDTVDIGAERVCDIVLATDEALANVVDHAYRDCSGAGVVTLDVSYIETEARIEIRVRDQGQWRVPEPTPISAIRGRGLILMRSLASVCTVEGSADGTTVSLAFHGCRRLEDSMKRFG
jgi:anti-sigma regulatory factor (Ser/Thr protein kinase)